MCVPGVVKQFVRKKELQHMTGECREVRGIHEKCFHSRNISLQTCQGVINIRKELLVKGKLTIAIRSAIHPTGVAGCASHWPFQSNQSIPPPFLPFRFFFSRAVYHMNRPILLAWWVHPDRDRTTRRRRPDESDMPAAFRRGIRRFFGQTYNGKERALILTVKA